MALTSCRPQKFVGFKLGQFRFLLIFISAGLYPGPDLSTPRSLWFWGKCLTLLIRILQRMAPIAVLIGTLRNAGERGALS